MDEGYFPTRQRDSIQPKVFKNIKPELNRLYRELINCFNQDSPLLCAIGLGVLIEGVCVDKGIADGNLEKRINDLSKFVPSLNVIEALQAFRQARNWGAHRLEAPTRDDAKAAIEVVEDLLNSLYELDYKASRIRKGQTTNSAKSDLVH